MAGRTGGAVVRLVRSAAVAPEVTDQTLLSRFAAGDESAFAALVGRHGAMVFAACRRALPTAQDAEDASQAVFLVLAAKAKRGRWQTSIANWLYTTARRVASKSRRAADRRARRESQAVPPAGASALDEMTGREAFAALDEELDRLPAIYRGPLVLCYLQELTRDEAAARLGIPPATLKSQLERGRKKLADALVKRGIVLGAGLLAVAATPAAGATPPQLLKSILAAVDDSPSPAAAALAQGIHVNALLTRTKLAILVAVGALGLGFTAIPIGAEPQKPAAEKVVKPAAKPDAKGDKAPAGAKERAISGKVVGPDGKPVAAELVMVWQDEKPQPLGKTNADGTFRVTVPLQSKGHGGWLVARAPGHGTDFLASGMEYLPQTMTPSAEVTLRLPRERPVRGRVLDQQGKPVAGVAVAASGISAYDSDASADGHLKRWAAEYYQRGSPPGGDRGMLYPVRTGGGSPYAATTDKDGRFEIAGAGSGQLVTLRLTGPGVADKEIVTLNRDGFDPAPVNKEAKDREVKGFTFGGKWMLYGPDPVVVLEPEKVIRGTVTDPEGKPRAGVRVAFSRPNKRDLSFEYNTAVTGPDGRYEIRGARKHAGYMVEVPADPARGLLPCQGFADDTAGYEPVTIDLRCARGVVVTGTVKNKATGEPVAAQMWVDVLADNPFVEKYPPFMHSASGATDKFQTDARGRYRVVTIPGPVILMGGPRTGRVEYKPPVEDPKYPNVFTRRDHGHLMFHGYGGGRGFVQGCWCRVIDAKPTDTELTVDVELEPAPKMLVKVVDADGKPVTGTLAAGVTYVEFAHPTEFAGDTLTVSNVGPKQERLLAVVHEKRRLVGTATVRGGDANAVVKLDRGGTVTGRLLGPDGKPLAGVAVHLSFLRREAAEAFDALKKAEFTTTDANGEFRVDALFPGQEFKLLFRRGQKRFGPDYGKAPTHAVAEPGGVVKLGDLKLEPTAEE